MYKYLLYIVLFFISLQQFHCQDDGIVALNLPVRNSLKFNRYVINPTFSFVREQNKYISFSNKREWAQFDNAPQSYLFSYSGRFSENIGMGVGLFQQNYGVLSTFGGLLNFSYNVVLNNDQNLTFGTNLGVYQSGINQGNVVVNFADPSLQNIPSNTLITINPGINYGTEFLDFGVSINNLASYNLTASSLIEENPEQSIQGHIMYTGYMDSRGFFDETKFSALFRSEFKMNQTVLSGIVTLTVPKGIWAQVGYNTFYGVSGGLGLNITNQIAIEYNFEKAIGDLLSFGNSHEVTLAYKFNNRYRYRYNGDDDEQAFLIPDKKPARVISSKKSNGNTRVSNQKKINNEISDKLTDEKLKIKDSTKLTDKNKAKADLEATRIEEEAQAKAAAAEKARIDTENKAKVDLEVKRIEEETKAKAAAAEKARIDTENKAKVDLEVKRIEEETKAKEEATAKLLILEKERLEADQKIDTVELDGVLIPIARDRQAIAIENLTKLTQESKIEQQSLLKQLRETVRNRSLDLDELKEENDLSEQGIFKTPQAFKSISAENAALESLKQDINEVIDYHNTKISELEKLYKERLKSVPSKQDDINVYYSEVLENLKTEQIQMIQDRANLMSSLEEIKVATEFERKRRIKRAAYDNEEDRYTKDRVALNILKQNTPLSNEPVKVADLDFGDTQNKNNIQIIKDVSNVENGYYLVLAVHDDISKRDKFLSKAISSGKSDIDFFYDVNTSKYYIFDKKFNSVESATSAIKTKRNEPLNNNMYMVKIEN
ncbi:MAG: PorP/SprF family type IX secretion system membrane protein [Flaviramulus sp.]|nr:PorP/SprF family type IX secretion system membrane protein [Flaviramulus sp.]